MKRINIYCLVATLVLGMSFALFAAESEPTSIPELVFNGEGSAVLEIEAFMLENEATVVSHGGASGGKAVLLNNTSSKATLDVKMPAGEFTMTAYINAPGEYEDAIYIGTDGKGTVRTYFNENYGHFGPGSTVYTFSYEEAGVAKITIEAAEFGMMVDRVEITKVEKE